MRGALKGHLRLGRIYCTMDLAGRNLGRVVVASFRCQGVGSGSFLSGWTVWVEALVCVGGREWPVWVERGC